MNKQVKGAILPKKSAVGSFSNKTYIGIGFVLAMMVFSLFFVAAESFAQSSQITMAGNDSVELLCDGRALRIERISRTQLKLTCRPHRGGGGTDPMPTAVPPTPMPDPQPTQPPEQPDPQPPQPDPEPQADARFVAPNGDDRNPGTLEQPYRTVQFAVDQLRPGQTLYIREGVYNEHVRMDNSGTVEAPIQVMAYQGERVVFDGRYDLPGGEPAGCNTTVSPQRCFVYTALFTIRGSNIVVDGIEVTQSRGRGIGVSGTSNRDRAENVTVRNCTVHEVRNAGVHMIYTRDIHVEGCNVFHAANYATHNRSASVLNWPVIVNTVSSDNVTFVNNVVHENYGEGMAAGRDSTNITFKNNTIYDNYALQLYIHRSQNVTADGNMLYHTGNPEFFRGGVPSSCIVVNSEANFTNSQPVKNVRITNNIVAGCSFNIDLWGNNGTGLETDDVLIAHNTLVNATANPNRQTASAIRIISGEPYRNVRFENNIIMQDEHAVARVPSTPNITFANNLWSQQPPAAAAGPGDVVANPNLMNPITALPGGAVDAGWFGIQPGSPAVDAGRQMVEVTVDFFGQPRSGVPDIGAYEQNS